jgi:hypothetical protein
MTLRGMHVSNWFGPNWNEFNGIIVNGKELTDLELKIINKTKHLKNGLKCLLIQKININLKRKEIADYLLCVALDIHL